MLKGFIGGIIRKAIIGEMENERKKLLSESASMLHDITYRMNALREQVGDIGRRVQTADLNIATHMIDGYVFTNNSPAGSVAWTDVNITYKGVTYTLTNGASALKYLYWTLATTPTTMQSSNTKPVLTPDDILIGINDAGIFNLVMGKMTPGQAITNGSLTGSEIGAGAIGSANIGVGAVIAAALGAGAVTTVKMAAGAVTANELGTGAVTATKIGAAAVGTAAIATGAVTTTLIANNAVTAGQLGAGAVGSTALAADAVTAAAIAAGAVGSTELASGAVTSAALGVGAVTSGAIGAGAIAESKLNLATHFLF
jgi:hypothetical protein